MAISMSIQQEQQKLMPEFQAANQAGDQAKMQALQEQFQKVVEDAQAKETRIDQSKPGFLRFHVCYRIKHGPNGIRPIARKI